MTSATPKLSRYTYNELVYALYCIGIVNLQPRHELEEIIISNDDCWKYLGTKPCLGSTVEIKNNTNKMCHRGQRGVVVGYCEIASDYEYLVAIPSINSEYTAFIPPRDLILIIGD